MKYPKVYIFITLLLCYAAILAQDVPRTRSGQTDKVYLIHADVQSFNKNIDAQRQILNGNVVFRHDSSYMYCDSAYFFEEDKSLEAFGAVRMEQGDTLFVYGGYLFYDGNIELARMRENVVMVSKQQDSTEVTLYTDSLDYDRNENIGYYFSGGRIVDANNELTSLWGQYSPATKIATFNDDVVLVNTDSVTGKTNFTLTSDTLEYSTSTKIATILGPSTIVSDSGTIYTSKGWYDTQANVSLLLDRSQVVSGDKILVGDSLLYDREAEIGEAFGNMSIIDTAQKVILTGNYGYYEEKTEYAIATDSACAIEYSQGDTLYLYADTLNLITVDSTYRLLRAFTGVRFYRIDIQGVCDSMYFNTADSVLRMFGKPMLWNDNQQLSGDSINIYMADSTVDYVHVPSSAFVAQEVDTAGYYNQLGGNDMKVFFAGKNVEHIDMDGNAESIFYPIDDKDSSMIGLNYTQSSYLAIYMNEKGKLKKLIIWPQPTGKITPIPDITPEEKTLKNFAWYPEERPIDKYDIFRNYKKKPIVSLRHIRPTNQLMPTDTVDGTQSIASDTLTVADSLVNNAATAPKTIVAPIDNAQPASNNYEKRDTILFPVPPVATRPKELE